ncbi:aminotransferase class I/II-fold pyridoxal phosphate-dependent enzyme [Sporosarcina limicola]|uniref:Aminotransferase n=1 Tax=Sporosarcina limicola TaxID=34101 RepID=A0A927MPP4_9BACL|nr:aminotransferase class I/II-fold pyridoxal phosphate-dependent enzyme [Sporosarcina limicola]MBE1555264.1 aminotransferase [Sporosarcina limicola]
MKISINKMAEMIEVPGIRKFSNKLVDYPNAVNLTIGQPDFPTPELVKKAGIKAIENNETGYSHNAGLLDLRKAVSLFFKDCYGFYYNPEHEIVITNGASEAIDSTFRTILSPGDEVILPTPIYLGYAPIIEMCGAKVVYLDTTDTGFTPSPQRLKSLITAKTKAVLFNFPSNPTGMTIEKEQMDELVAVLEQHEIFILSDEIYSENTFTGEHVSFGQYEVIRDRLFLIHGLSKSHSMTGWRIGYVLGPKEYMAHVLKVHLYNSVCASLPSQHAAIVALNECRHTPEEMNVEYMRRRDFVYNRLVKMGLDVIKPNGAFYIFPSIAKYGMDSYSFATKLLKEGGVAAVPGSAFSTYGEGYLRISYAYAMPVLEEGMDRLEKFLQQF